jgi:hypothetical protein
MTSIDPITPNTYPVYPEPQPREEEPVEETPPSEENSNRDKEAQPPEDRPYESWDDHRGKEVDTSR